MELTPETIALLQSSPYGLIFLAAIWGYKRLREILKNLALMEDRINVQIRALANNSRRRR